MQQLQCIYQLSDTTGTCTRAESLSVVYSTSASSPNSQMTWEVVPLPHADSLADCTVYSTDACFVEKELGNIPFTHAHRVQVHHDICQIVSSILGKVLNILFGSVIAQVWTTYCLRRCGSCVNSLPTIRNSLNKQKPCTKV